MKNGISDTEAYRLDPEFPAGRIRDGFTEAFRKKIRAAIRAAGGGR